MTINRTNHFETYSHHPQPSSSNSAWPSHPWTGCSTTFFNDDFQRTDQTQSGVLSDDELASYHYVTHSQCSPQSDHISDDYAINEFVQPLSESARDVFVAHASQHNSPISVNSALLVEFDQDVKPGNQSFEEATRSPTFSVGSDHLSMSDRHESIDQSSPAGWFAEMTTGSTNATMAFDGSSSSVTAHPMYVGPATHPQHAQLFTTSPVEDLHGMSYPSFDWNMFPAGNDLESMNAAYNQLTNFTSLSVAPEDQIQYDMAPSPPNMSTELPTRSMIVQPSSSKVSVASSSRTDLNMNEAGQESSQGRKRSRSNAPATQSAKAGYGMFRVATSSASDSDRSHDTNTNRKTEKKPRGGRKKGSQLSIEKKRQVKACRIGIACWTCALQRDECIPGPQGGSCDRCTKRHAKGILMSSNELGCIAEHLYDYRDTFVPVLFDKLHNEEQLQNFMDISITSFYLDNPIHIYIMPIEGCQPIKCEFYEFQPKTAEVLISRQGVHNPHTNQYIHTQKPSLPLSLRNLSLQDEKRFDEYFDSLAQDPRYMRKFPDICYSEPPDDFLRRLLAIMVSYVPHNKKEADFVLSVNKMLLLMHSFGRACIIPDDQQSRLAKLKHYTGASNISTQYLPRMANRQLKFLFMRLLRSALNRVLKTLDNTFRSSKGLWTTAFYGMLGLAMAFEDMENSVAIYLQTDRALKVCSPESAEMQLNKVSSAIDAKFTFLHKLFRTKHKVNLFSPAFVQQHEKRRQKIFEGGAKLVGDIELLIREKYESYLRFQQIANVTMDNPEAYYGRLVSQFLCSFFGPE